VQSAVRPHAHKNSPTAASMSLKTMLASTSCLARGLIRNCCNKQAGNAQSTHSLARNAQLTHSLARNEGKVEGLTRNVSILGALARSDKLISASSGSRQFSTGRIFHINDKDGLIRADPTTELLHHGLIRVVLAVSLGVYIGARLSMKMVAFLEEYEIFVPDEDDDD